MLQQTTVPHATPYWHRFLERWPTVADLAAADPDQVMAAWAGLGYYARARNLWPAPASGRAGGAFRPDLPGLLALPGVGPYTAGAIRAVAFDLPAVVVDGNVERVLARLHAVETPLPRAKDRTHRAGRRTGRPGPPRRSRPGPHGPGGHGLYAPSAGLRGVPLEFRVCCQGNKIANRLPPQGTQEDPARASGCGVRRSAGVGRIWLRKRPETGLLGGCWKCRRRPGRRPSGPRRRRQWRRRPSLPSGIPPAR